MPITTYDENYVVKNGRQAGSYKCSFYRLQQAKVNVCRTSLGISIKRNYLKKLRFFVSYRFKSPTNLIHNKSSNKLFS